MTQQGLKSAPNAKPKKPAIENWFRAEPEPCLLGSQCTTCQSYFFPRETFYCKNPDCTGTEFQEVEFSRTGTLWSFTNGCYKPPAPFVATTDPFEPYTLAAVELAKEKMVILGQVAGASIADLKIGMEMELVIDTLFEDDEYEHTVWKWKPVKG